jgi:hypothetical protein
LLGRLHRGNAFWVEVFVKQGFLPNKSVFACPILELKLIGLESVNVVCVDVEIKQVETRAASNLVAIFFILNPN